MHIADSVRAFPVPCPCLFGLVEQFPPDQHPSYLRSAGTNLVQLGITPQPTGGEFVDIAIAAQRLDRLTGHPCRLFRSIEYRTGGVFARRFAAVASLSHGVNIGLACV